MHDTNHSKVIIKPSPLRKKIRRSANEWRSIIADYKASDLTQRDFCQQRDIAYSLKKSDFGNILLFRCCDSLLR